MRTESLANSLADDYISKQPPNRCPSYLGGWPRRGFTRPLGYSRCLGEALIFL
jgi:hypothetical protein